MHSFSSFSSEKKKFAGQIKLKLFCNHFSEPYFYNFLTQLAFAFLRCLFTLNI